LPSKDNFPVHINNYEDVPEEPKFDPDRHLDLHKPDYIRVLGDFQKKTTLLKVDSSHGSPFAYSSPFQVIEENGKKLYSSIKMYFVYRCLVKKVSG